MAKKLIVLLVIVIVLSVLVVIKIKRQTTDYDITKEMEIKKILPESFAVTDVSKMEIYPGSDPKQIVILAKTDETWKLESAWNAPVEQELVQKFLEKLRDLRGEPRDSDKETLPTFELGHEQSLHIKLYGKEKPIFHLLVGKKAKEKAEYGFSNACFVREADSENIYMVGENLRNEIGLWDEGPNKSPKNDHWLDKNFLKFPKDEDITGITLQYPDKQISFVRKEKAVEPKNGENQKRDAKKEYEWALATDVIGKELKKAEVQGLLDNIKNAKCDDVVDPSKKKEWGLEKPLFKLEIALNNNQKKTVFGGRPDPNKEGYCYLEEKPDIVYKISGWAYGSNLFPSLTRLFDLPSCKLDKALMKEVEIVSSDGKAILGFEEKKDKDKTENAWTVIYPTAGLELNKDTANDILNKVSSLEFQDYTDEKNEEIYGLSNPECRITFKMKDDSKHTIRIGKNSLCTDGRYAIIDDLKPIGVISKYNINTLWPAFEKLFKTEIPAPKNITEVTVGRKEDSFALKKTEGKWQIILGAETKEAFQQNAESMVSLLKNLKASKITLQENTLEGKSAIATVMFAEEEEKRTLNIYERQEQSYLCTLENKGVIYWLNAGTIETILERSGHYLPKPAEVKKEEKTPEPTKDNIQPKTSETPKQGSEPKKETTEPPKEIKKEGESTQPQNSGSTQQPAKNEDKPAKTEEKPSSEGSDSQKTEQPK